MALRFVAILALLASCYDVPMPACGFSCLEEGECPDGYTCDRSGDGFCHLTGLQGQQTCPGHEGVHFDDDPPTINTIQPNPGDAIDPNSVIVVEFSETVTGVNEDSFMAIVDSSGEKLLANIIPLGGGTWELQAVTGFPIGEPFTVTLTDAIRDVAGHPFVEVAIAYSNPLPAPPALQGSTPGDSQSGLSVGTLLQLFFDKPAQNILSKLHVVDPNNVPVPFMYDPTSSTSSPLFNFRWQLLGNTTYMVVIDPGLEDIDGNATSIPTAFSFTTGVDTLGPRIYARTPGFFAANVPVTTGVSIAFDEAAFNVVDGSIRLEKNGVVVPSKLTYDALNKNASLRPDNQLDGLTSYDVVVTTMVTDMFGNAVLDGGASFQTNVDNIGPQIRSTTPRTGSANAPVSTTIAMTFDEPTTGLDATTLFVTADDLTVAGTLVASDGNRTWTFTPDAPLPAISEIDVDVELAQDSFGNSTSYFYSFTTAP